MRFRVLGEPMRLRILQVLSEGERAVTVLASEVGTTQPNVSKHLRILEDSGLVWRQSRVAAVLCGNADPMVFDICDAVCRSLARRLSSQSASLARPGRRPRPPRRPAA